MDARTEPPFRAEHVGSLLRPRELVTGPAEVPRRPHRRRGPARGRGRRDPRRRRPAGGPRPARGDRRRVPPHLVAHGLHLPAGRRHPHRRGTRGAVPQRRGRRPVHRRRAGRPQAAAPRRADLHRRLPVPGGRGAHGDAEDDHPVAQHGAAAQRHRRRRPQRLPGPRRVLGRPRRRVGRRDPRTRRGGLPLPAARRHQPRLPQRPHPAGGAGRAGRRRRPHARAQHPHDQRRRRRPARRA